ncbi:MAG: class I SAM-dependent methyltransferase [Puniceicoccales bacterium]
MDSDPTGKSARAQKDQALFDEIAQSYVRKDLIASSQIARRQRLLSTLAAVPGASFKRVLEVGCGAGFTLQYAGEAFESYVGIDYSQKLIDYATANLETDRHAFHCCDAFDFQPSAPFDLVLMIGVLHHVDDDEKLLRQLKTYLAPGGWLVANEPQGANPLIRALRQGRKSLDREFSEDQIEYRASQLEKKYQNAGLANVRVRGQGVFSTPFAEVPMSPQALTAPASKLTVSLDRMLESSCQGLVKAVGWNLVAAGQRAS